MTRLDRSFRLSLSACFASICLHLRLKTSFCDAAPGAVTEVLTNKRAATVGIGRIRTAGLAMASPVHDTSIRWQVQGAARCRLALRTARPVVAMRLGWLRIGAGPPGGMPGRECRSPGGQSCHRAWSWPGALPATADGSA